MPGSNDRLGVAKPPDGEGGIASGLHKPADQLDRGLLACEECDQFKSCLLAGP